MATETDLKSIVKISKANYEVLIGGGSVSGYTYDSDALYLVQDDSGDYDFITNDEIDAMWDSEGYYILSTGLYSAESVTGGIAELEGLTIKNGVLKI